MAEAANRRLVVIPSAAGNLLLLTCRSLLALLVGMTLSATASAQSIRGIAVERGLDVPVAGVVVLLLDAHGGAVARALTNERGEFRVAAPSPGTYRLRTMRVGFRPITSDAFLLALGQELAQRVELTGLRFLLDTIRVVDRSSCRIARDSAAVTFAVWEQIRAALTAAQISLASKVTDSRVVMYERQLDPSRRRVQAQRAYVRQGRVAEPWYSLSPDSLHRVGFVDNERDTVTYYAPGLDVLLSNRFLEDHCFRLVRPKDAALLGMAFEPTRARRNIPEIRGTLLLDRATSELRKLEFEYVNIPSLQSRNASGAMEFVRMRNGGWAISRWHIRMPLIGRGLERSRRGLAIHAMTTSVLGIRVAGGELAVVTSEQDTLFVRPPLRISGRVSDSTSGAPVGFARVSLEGTSVGGMTDSIGRFTLTDVLPGEYTLSTRSPALDSIGAVVQTSVTLADSSTFIEVRVPKPKELAAGLCRDASLAGKLSTDGVILGRVALRDDSLPLRNVRVVAEWNDPSRDASRGFRAFIVKHEVRSDERGLYLMCRVPLDRTLYLRAVTDSGFGSVTPVMITAAQRFVRADLAIDRNARATATLVGVVVVDSTEQPIAEAEVALPSLSRQTYTNERGEFRVDEVPAGTHEVSVRRIGYGPMTARVTLAPNETLERRVVLSKAVALAPVTVTARALVEFEEHRRIGLGRFLDRADLAKVEGMTFANVMRQLSSTHIVSDPRFPSKAYIKGLRMNCYARVYVDQLLVYAPKVHDDDPDPDVMFDLNSISPDRIEAVEWYAGPASTPLKYSTLNSNCGVLVIHTRRSP